MLDLAQTLTHLYNLQEQTYEPEEQDSSGSSDSEEEESAAEPSFKRAKTLSEFASSIEATSSSSETNSDTQAQVWMGARRRASEHPQGDRLSESSDGNVSTGSLPLTEQQHPGE